MISTKCKVLYSRPELYNLKVLRYLYIFLIFSLIIMPQYFGVHIGYDITCTRFANLLILAYMIFNPRIFTHFWCTITRCASMIPLTLYLFVSLYTMVFRIDLNAFFLIFFEVLNFCLLIYGIRFVIGYRETLKYILWCTYFLSVYGLVEFVYGKSLFLQFLRTIPTNVQNGYRSGHYRIMGPCGHSLGYGLLLLLLIAVTCYDWEREKIYVFRRPVLIVLLMVNVFLTGSRSTLGIAVVEVLVLFLLQNGTDIKKSLMLALAFLVFIAVFLLLFHDTSIGRYVLGQIASVIDHVFGTNYAALFGVDTQTLENSTSYRKALPYIFTLDWLNPWVGRGRDFGGAQINGVFIHSIDNYYVVQYVKYAYPGLVSYCAFMLTTLAVLIKEIYVHRSAIAKVVMVAGICYFYNLWWVDALQTLKFIYLVIAVFYAYKIWRDDAVARVIGGKDA